MLSKNHEQLSAILALVDKKVSAKVLSKKPQYVLDEAERWAVTLNAKRQEEQLGRKVPQVPEMPAWLFKA